MPAPGTVGLQFPEPLAPDLWPSGCPEAPGSGPRKGKAEAERASGVGGVHTSSELYTALSLRPRHPYRLLPPLSIPEGADFQFRMGRGRGQGDLAALDSGG